MQKLRSYVTRVERQYLTFVELGFFFLDDTGAYLKLFSTKCCNFECFGFGGSQVLVSVRIFLCTGTFYSTLYLFIS